MGSSARKKKEKKQDFQKPKLKVGKTKAKASNFTDTSFKSKSIVLHQQLREDAPDVRERFKHQLSLTSSRTDSQRRDALSFLAGQLSTNPPTNPVGTSTLLHKVLPCMSDSSGPVRNQLLRLLRALPADQVRPHVERVMLYIRGAMTNISQEIKDDGLNYLEWLLDVAGDCLVAAPGCWIKPLKDFMSVLGWASNVVPSHPAAAAAAAAGRGGKSGGGGAASSGWTAAPRTTFGAKQHGQSFPRQLAVLARLLETGLGAPAGVGGSAAVEWHPRDWHAQFTRAPAEPDALGFLGLFRPPRGEDGEVYRDRADRQAVFHRRFGDAVEAGVGAARREAGAAGRAAALVEKALRDGMDDYEPPSARAGEEGGADSALWEGFIM